MKNIIPAIIVLISLLYVPTSICNSKGICQFSSYQIIFDRTPLFNVIFSELIVQIGIAVLVAIIVREFLKEK